MEYQIFPLKNGIRVIHQQVDSPVAHFGVIVNTGSRDELEHEQGMAHFIEHTIFKGTKKRKAVQIINQLEDVGGELNAYTTKEETAIYATFLNEYYQRTIELVSDIVINSTFPEKELILEKEVIIEEINSYNDSPSELIYDEFEELVFNSHPIARNILGTPEKVRSFNKEQVKQFMKKNYQTNEMVICSVGKIKPTKFESLIRKHFELMDENVSERNRIPFNGYIPQNIEVEKDTFQSHCVIGAEAYKLTNELRLPMVLLNNILGGSSMNSRLNMALRERNGLAYNVEANYSSYTDTGVFMIYFGTERNNLYKAIDLVESEFRILRAKKLGPKILAKSKKQLIGQLAIANENREDLMLTIGRSYLYFNKVDRLQDVFQKIENITANDLHKISNEILAKNNLSKLIFL
ncbi:MAG: pitrilysin family protein [Prolixibacteraceae bacterium]|jgi:predicted Zn-dependent peptidase|nr:pitrilysin family protein [Prolixibacteraceae bacterium]